MPWYKTGTVNVTLNSNAVIGTGTAFIANSRVGDAFRGPDGGWYEITNIASDTAMAIDPPYQGATNASGVYALAPMQGYVKDSADALRSLVNQFGGVLAVLGETPTTSGVREALNLADTDGLPEGLTNKYMSASGVRSITLTGLDLTQSIPITATDTILAALGKLQASKAAKGANSDITEINGLAKPITTAQGGVATTYIEGLYLTYVGPNSISVSPGTAYIPGAGKVAQITAPFMLSGMTLAASTMHHVYLFDNSGTPTVEVVTTSPSAPYNGRARTKSGDTSRRYIGSLLSLAANTLAKFSHSVGRISYGENSGSLPFTVLNSAVVVAQTVNCLTVVPVTATHLTGLLINLASDTTARLGNPDFQNPVSAANHTITSQPSSCYACDIPLSTTQTFQWRHDGAANGMFQVRTFGYIFER